MKQMFSFTAAALSFAAAVPAPVSARPVPMQPGFQGQRTRPGRTLALSPVAARNGFVSHALTYTVRASTPDPANDALTFTLTEAPAGMTIAKTAPTTAQITWTPTIADYFAFHVVVTDKAGHSDSKPAAVHVYSDANANASISLSGVTSSRQAPKTVTASGIFANTGSGAARDVTITSAQLGPVNAVSLPGSIYIASGNRRRVWMRFTNDAAIAKGVYPLTFSGTYTTHGAKQTFSGKVNVNVP